jgi:hypothetical protein
MYAARVPNRTSSPAYLLREGYREDGKVKSRTLANLSHWPLAKIERLRQVLRDEDLPDGQEGLTMFAQPAARPGRGRARHSAQDRA